MNKAKILATTLNLGEFFCNKRLLIPLHWQRGGKCDGYMRMLQMNPPTNASFGLENGKDKLTFLSLHFLKYD